MDFKVNTDTWFIFCLLFIGILALFIFLYIIIPYITRKRNTKRRHRRLHKKLDDFERLENKNKEVKIKDLESTNKKLQVSIREDLSMILGDNKETDLGNFFSNFEKLYPNFKDSLCRISSNLTANELKLCAFLRLNLSSKEISEILHITPESVHKARYRLRKKLHLSSKDDLSNFILNI